MCNNFNTLRFKFPIKSPKTGCGRLPDKNLFIVLEFMEEGDLDTMIERSDVDFPWSDRVCILGDVAEGMTFLHDTHDSIHRDLKSGNVLLGKENGILRGKIGDFGMSKFLSNQNTKNWADDNSTKEVDVHRSMTNGLGTPSNMAPEIWSNMIKKTKLPITKKVDVYAYGVIMFEVSHRMKAWKGVNFTHIIQKSVIAGNRPRCSVDEDDGQVSSKIEDDGQVSSKIEDDGKPKDFDVLIEKCWHQDMKSRPNFRDIWSYFKKEDACQSRMYTH